MRRKNRATGEVIKESATFDTKDLAVDWATSLERSLRRGQYEPPPTAKSVDDVLDQFVKSHVKKKELRTEKEMVSLLDRQVRPRIGKKSIYALRRSDIIKMMDEIEEEVSARQADKALSILSSAFNKHAARDDHFKSPIVRGMTKLKLRDLSRSRTLTDAEIRQVYAALPQVNPVYARIVDGLLRSAQRLDEIAGLPWTELDGEAWTIPPERYKTKTEHVVPMTWRLKKIIGARPEGADKKNVFAFSTTDGETPFSGFSKCKKALDKAINKVREDADLAPIPSWRLHDLRRTARSLMSRAAVRGEIAERVLGHVQPGVSGIYDRWAYFPEKKAALEALSVQIDEILRG